MAQRKRSRNVPSHPGLESFDHWKKSNPKINILWWIASRKENIILLQERVFPGVKEGLNNALIASE